MPGTSSGPRPYRSVSARSTRPRRPEWLRSLSHTARAKGKTALQDIAALAGSEIKNADTVLFDGGGRDAFGYEPKVTGAAFNKNNINKLSQGIPGEQGVYFITVKEVRSSPAQDEASMMYMQRMQMQQQMNQQIQGAIPQVLKKKAKIIDNRSNFF